MIEGKKFRLGLQIPDGKTAFPAQLHDVLAGSNRVDDRKLLVGHGNCLQ